MKLNLSSTPVNASIVIASLIAPLAGASTLAIEDDSFIPLEEPSSLVAGRRDRSALYLANNSGEKNYSSKCKVKFSDRDALNIIPEYAQDTFAFGPYWIQSCSQDRWAYVKPTVNNHFHLSYENADMQICQILNTCPEHDPRDQPRTLRTHTNSEKLELTLYKDSKYLPFGIKKIRIPGNTSVKICFKKRNESGAPWVTNEDNLAAIPGRWSCWNKLGTGNWDLSNWVNNVVVVTVIGTGEGGTFGIDDVVYRLY